MGETTNEGTRTWIAIALFYALGVPIVLIGIWMASS